MSEVKNTASLVSEVLNVLAPKSAAASLDACSQTAFQDNAELQLGNSIAARLGKADSE